MKVLLATFGSKIVGSNRSMLILAKLLQEKYGVDVTVLLPGNGKLEELLQKENIKYKIIEYRSGGWLYDANLEKSAHSVSVTKQRIRNHLSKSKIKKYISNNKFDIVHLNTVSTPGFIADIAHKCGCKVVWHIREEMEFFDFHFINKTSAIKKINSADKIVLISKSLANAYPYLNHDNTQIIYNGITDEYYNPSHKILQNKKVTICFAGHLVKNKGALVLLKAVNTLVNELNYKNIRVKIMGDDVNKTQYYYDILKYHKDNNLENYVELMGFVENIKEVYDVADIFCMCSKGEAFGRVTCEAMLNGLCVIGADSGATPELIDNFSNGILFKINDCNDLCEKLLFVLNNKEKAISIADNGRRHIYSNFTARSNAKSVFKLYSELV